MLCVDLQVNTSMRQYKVTEVCILGPHGFHIYCNFMHKIYCNCQASVSEGCYMHRRLEIWRLVSPGDDTNLEWSGRIGLLEERTKEGSKAKEGKGREERIYVYSSILTQYF